jgi:hypothetical protein
MKTLKYNGLTYFATVTTGIQYISALVAVQNTLIERLSEEKLDGYLMGLMDQGMQYNPILAMMTEWDNIPSDFDLTNLNYTTILLG